MSMGGQGSIAEEAAAIVGGSRREQYGGPERSFECVARLWTAHLQNRGLLVDGAALSPLDVAALMRFLKEARLVQAPSHRDSYVDLVGYALCGAELAGLALPATGGEAR